MANICGGTCRPSRRSNTAIDEMAGTFGRIGWKNAAVHRSQASFCCTHSGSLNRALEQRTLPPDRLWRVVANIFDRLTGRPNAASRFFRLPGQQIALPFALAAVHPPQHSSGLPVIAFQWLESFIRNPGAQHFQIEHAHQGITSTDAPVQKSQWPLADMAFQPKRDTAQVHGQWVFVHAVDAMPDHIADRLAHLLGGRFILAGADTRQFLAHAARGGQQEMPQAASRITHPDR